MTVVITQVRRDTGEVILTVEYSRDAGSETIEVDAEQIVDRLKELRRLLGRKPKASEAKEVVVALINEIRAGKQPLVEIIPWEDYIGVDLEA